jgi:hypothetical protein
MSPSAALRWSRKRDNLLFGSVAIVFHEKEVIGARQGVAVQAAGGGSRNIDIAARVCRGGVGLGAGPGHAHLLGAPCRAHQRKTPSFGRRWMLLYYLLVGRRELNPRPARPHQSVILANK